MICLFDGEQPLRTPRLLLTPLDRSHLSGLGPWLQEAIEPEWSPADIEAGAVRGEAALISLAQGEAPVGLAILGDGPHAKAATVAFVCIEPAMRYRGLGGEAALAIERRLRGGLAVERVYAPVPETRGLAIYFWLRLGYRPLPFDRLRALLPSRAPAPPRFATGAGGIWLLRDSD